MADPGTEVSAEVIDRPIQRDNEYGTPEEDAFRRDFTVNALFYDIGTFSIIDYTGGLEDLDKRVIRCIGNPDVRFVEDPVRMLRALVLAARLDFSVDGAVMDAIERKAPLIGQASSARLLEEYYKILRSGHARSCFDHLADSGLLEHMSPELLNDDGPLAEAFEAVDAYRKRFDDAPETLSNPILAGTLLLPLGLFRDEGIATGTTTIGSGKRRTCSGRCRWPARTSRSCGTCCRCRSACSRRTHRRASNAR